MERIAAIIGAGLIGRAWAMVFARAGWRVRLYDNVATQLDAARGHIATSLAEQQAARLIADAPGALARIAIVARLEDAVAGADWVQENLPEQIEIKREVFHAPDAAAPWTASATIERARAVMAQIGQEPILVRRELDGFILNRVQGALLSEAMRLVAEGYVSPEDLDKTIAHGLGLRWSFMGPFATIELNAPGGVADYCARYSGFYRRLAAEPPSPDVWQGESAARVVAALGAPPTAGELEQRMDRRDRRLLALARHKRDQCED